MIEHAAPKKKVSTTISLPLGEKFIQLKPSCSKIQILLTQWPNSNILRTIKVSPGTENCTCDSVQSALLSYMEIIMIDARMYNMTKVEDASKGLRDAKQIQYPGQARPGDCDSLPSFITFWYATLSTSQDF